MSKKKIDPRIKEYELKNGQKKYQFQLYLGVDPTTGKKQRTTRRNFDTQRAAELALIRLETQLSNEGAESLKEKKSKHFREIYEAWFANYKRTVKESTWSSTKFIFNKHILPIFGDNYIDKMDVIFCQKVVNDWSETAPKIFKKYKNYTSNVFDYAMTLQLITMNPMKIITMPRGEMLIKEDKVIPYYTKEELIEFLTATKTHNQMYHTFFTLLAFTGLRKGEALALEWSDIDFKRKTLDVNKTLSRGDNNTVIINRPKTKKGIRNILIDDNLIAVLKQHRKRDGNLLQLHSNDLIFNNAGEPYKPVSTKTWLLSIYRAYPNLKQISAHGFRHTHASLMFEAGAEIKDVQERLGHADIQTTSNIYTHVTESRNEKVMDKFIAFMDLG